MGVRRSRRKVIGLSGGRKLVAATSVDRRRARTLSAAWFGSWWADTPPWFASLRGHELKRRKR